MSQYSNELSSIIKQLRKISANTCAESEQMPFYERDICGTLPGINGQAAQFNLVKVYTRDVDTGQIVLSHYEDSLGNIVPGAVVEECCGEVTCGPPYLCTANIADFNIDGEGNLIIDITGSSTTGFIQFDVAGALIPPTPQAGPWALEFPLEILEAFRTGETTITLMIGNNEDMDIYCSFSFVTLVDSNTDVKEDQENPVWQPFPALTAGLGCTGTLTYSMLLDATGNGVTVDAVTGDVTIPAGIYIEENSWVYVEVRCDGVLVAVAGLQLLNQPLEIPTGFELTWNDIANSPFVTHTDLNTFINANGGAANYTSVVTVGNVQTFYGGTAVDLGNNFMVADANIVSIRDEAFQVVAQGDNCQNNCGILELIALPALVTQGSGCQSDNSELSQLNLQAMTTQGDYCQSGNALLAAISLPLLATQGGGKNLGNQSFNPSLLSLSLPNLATQKGENQSNNTILPTISLPALTAQTATNQSYNAGVTTISLPLLATQTVGNQIDNAVLTTLSLPSLTTQTNNNQRNNAALTTLSLPSLTTQEAYNQSSNALLTTLSLSLLTEQLNDNQRDNPALVTLTLTELTTQAGANQSNNPLLVALTLPALATQLSANQSDNAAMTTFTASLLTSQANNNQTNCPLMTLISTPALTSLGTGNYVGCTYNLPLTIDVDASLAGAADILTAAAGGAIIL